MRLRRPTFDLSRSLLATLPVLAAVIAIVIVVAVQAERTATCEVAAMEATMIEA